MVVFPLVSDTAHTKDWLGKQPAGTVAPYVAPKGDSGNDAMTLAPGAGRQGNDCLLVTSPSPEAGLPGFWLMVGKSNGRGAVANCGGNDGYLSRGMPANRLSFWLRFEPGFRAKSCRGAVQNVHVGTYHHDPAKPGVRKETDNWHFYHQLLLRHDQANGDWMHVVLNDIPQHQRGRSKYLPAPNPTRKAGDYWQLATRIYVDMSPYFGDPEIAYPVRMWVDDVQMTEQTVSAKVTLQISPPKIQVVAGKTTTMLVRLVNRTSKPVSGVVGHRSHYTWTPAIVDPATNKSVHRQRITLPPGETVLEFSVTPRSGVPSKTTLQHSVVFASDDQVRTGGGSLADPRVCLHASYGVSGPCDGSPASDAITLTIQ